MLQHYQIIEIGGENVKVLLIGVGGVGEAIAKIAKRRDPKGEWLQQLVLSDYDFGKAQKTADLLNDPNRFPAEKINARNKDEIIAMAQKYNVDLIMNACDPSFNETIFDAAYDAGCNYMDMAMTLSVPHPEDPYHKTYIKMGDYQFERFDAWKEKGLLALLGMGIDPGVSNVFARYAEKHLFDEIDEIHVRDGGNLHAEGYDITFGFSIWTTIDECLNPPFIWERDKGWYTTEPFSEPEIFTFPAGIGDVEVVNVEHEELLMIPRYINKGLKKVTFKYGLGKEFITMLKNLRALRLDDKHTKIKIGNTEITPRDFVAMVAPSPTEVADKLKGKTCVGTWVIGKKDGLERQVFLYQVTDNEEVMKKIGSQAVVAQTAFSPVLAMELLAKGIWKGVGVHCPEFFDPDPFVERMEIYEFPGAMMEMDSEYKSALDAARFKEPLMIHAAAGKEKSAID